MNPSHRTHLSCEARYNTDPGALHHAVADGVVAHVQALLMMGSDPNARMLYGFTPLHVAAAAYGRARSGCAAASVVARRDAIIGLLLDAGADVTLRDEGHRLASYHAQGFLPLRLREAIEQAAEAGAFPVPVAWKTAYRGEAACRGRVPKAERTRKTAVA